MPRCPEPVGPHEVAVMLNVSRQRINQLRQMENFPAPWRSLATGHIWRDTDIENYARTTGRNIKPWEG